MLHRFKKDQKYVVFDAETESLNLVLSRPWQLSYLICDNSGTVLKSFDRFIDVPDLQVSKDAARITGFNRENFDRLKESPKKIWDDFKKFLFDPQYYLVGHNILNFDIYQLKQLAEIAGEKINYQSWLDRCIDTNALAKAVKKSIPVEGKNDQEKLEWQFKLIRTRFRAVKSSLSVMCKYYDIPFDATRLHDGLYDISLNAKVFSKLIHETEF